MIDKIIDKISTLIIKVTSYLMLFPSRYKEKRRNNELLNTIISLIYKYKIHHIECINNIVIVTLRDIMVQLYFDECEHSQEISLKSCLMVIDYPPNITLFDVYEDHLLEDNTFDKDGIRIMKESKRVIPWLHSYKPSSYMKYKFFKALYRGYFYEKTSGVKGNFVSNLFNSFTSHNTSSK